MEILDLVVATVAALLAGLVNALAGGGTLISFPALTLVGVPAVAANVTNTVALCPGYLGGTFAQRRDLAGQRRRLLLLLPAAALGGLAGGALLLLTSEKLFRTLVPWLILAAAALLAAQGPVKRLAARHVPSGRDVGPAAVVAVFLAAIYGGYFGAGLGILMLAVLGLFVDDDLVRVNALKQAISIATNTTAALFFVFSGRVVWAAAIAMMAGALVGGHVGGALASRMKPAVLRGVVVALGVVVAGVYFAR
jgi:uncharacterized membrane protein YfcA